MNPFLTRALCVLLFLALLLGAANPLAAQVGIGTDTPAQDAILELKASDQALLLPRLGTPVGAQIGAPEAGMIAYDTVAQDVYYYNGTSWSVVGNTLAGGDNWGSQVAQTAGQITGKGTAGDPIDLADGSSSGDILSWTGSNWTSQAPMVEQTSDLITSTAAVSIGSGSNAVAGGSDVSVDVAANSSSNAGLAPATGGQANVVYATDGSGNPGWADVTSKVGAGQGLAYDGGSQALDVQLGDALSFNSNTVRLGGTMNSSVNIQQNGNNFYLSGSGQVGIGTSSPNQKLDVDGDVRIRTLNSGTALTFTDGSGVLGSLSLSPEFGISSGTLELLQQSANVDDHLAWNGNEWVPQTPAVQQTSDLITSTAAVSIGNGSNAIAGGSDVSVDVAANSSSNAGLAPATGGQANVVYATDGSGNPGWADVTSKVGAGQGLAYDGGSQALDVQLGDALSFNSNTVRLGGTMNSSVNIQQNGNNFYFSGSGQVGIGTSSPNQKLDVDGNIRSRALNSTTALTYTDANGVLKSANTTAELTFSSGNVGIAQQSANNGEVLKWDGSSWRPQPDDSVTYSAGTGINITGSNVVENTGDLTPTDDYNTSLALSNDTLKVTDNGGTLRQDLAPLIQDDDWAGAGSGATFLKNNSDSVGIGTATPQSKLHVDAGTQDKTGLLVSGELSFSGSVPNLGAGTRLMYIPRYGVFRMGKVDGNQWDNANTGRLSVAMGENVVASASYAVALGDANTASSFASFTAGVDNTVSANYGVAIGQNNTAQTNDNAVAIGEENVSEGIASTALGYQTTASSWGAFSAGRNTEASGSYSMATGYNSIASNFASVATGFNTVASGDNSFVVGEELEVSGNHSVGIALGSVAQNVSQSRVMSILGGNVGIGTKAPGHLLSVAGDVFLQKNVLNDQALEVNNQSTAGPKPYPAGRRVATFLGRESSTTDDVYGVQGLALGEAAGNKHGMYMRADGNAGTKYGGYAEGTGIGTNYGFYAQATDNLASTNYGLYGKAGDASNAYAVYGEATTSAAHAGYFSGKVHVTGGRLTLSDGTDSITFPNTDGSNGQVLVTDGSGNVTWQSVGGGNTLDAAYDQGGPGAGRTITADAGAVEVSGNGGLLATNGTVGSGPTMPSGSGVRMVWNPRKAAFRAGRVNSTQWNTPLVGDYSFAAGENTQASGQRSVALGDGAEATGNASFAAGSGTRATATYSMAMVENTTADGFGATAIGGFNVASGDYSIAVGGNTETRSAYELAAGVFNTTYSASSPSGFAPSDRIFVVGNGTSAGNRSDMIRAMKSGEMAVGDITADPTANLHVYGDFRVQTGPAVANIVDSATVAGFGGGPALADTMLLTGSAVGRLVSDSLGGGGLTNFAETQATSTDSAAVWTPATGTNNSIALLPRGNGALTADTADGSASGGNARGEYAVDWQMERNTAFGVASGNYSTVGGGLNNRAESEATVVAGGKDNVSDAAYAAIGGGENNQSSSLHTFVGGGSNNAANWPGAVVAGGENNTADNNNAAILGGQGNIVKGLFSGVVGGFQNTVKGDSAFVLGSADNKAQASASVVIGGPGSIAQSFGEVVVGTFNDTLTGGFSKLAYQNSDRLFVIGNGSGDASRSNAFVVKKSGNATLKGQLTLSDGSDPFTLPNADGSNGQVLVTDGSGNVTWQNPGGSGVWGRNTDTIFTPNPTSDYVRIGQTAGPQSARFQIYDASSQQLVLKATDAASNYAGAQISFGNATNQAFISNVSSNELFISAFDSLALGSNRIAIGPSSQAVGLQSMAFGTFSTAQSDSGMAIGHIVQSSATSGFVIGKGIDGPIVNTPLENDSPNTIVMGMNTDTASLFIDKGTGPGQPGNVGIQTESPKADLDVQGSYRTKVTTITSDYTVQPDDYSIFVDNGTPSDFNVTLPDPTLQRNKGRVLIIRCYGTKGAFLDPQGSGTEIEGNSGYTVSNGEAATIQCNGTEWYVISEATP